MSFVVSCISINASKAVYVFELIPLILVGCGVPVAAISVVVANISVSDIVAVSYTHLTLPTKRIV